ncbi:MAG: hypothetical protein JNL92_05120 [Opitutaceae bacterium]|nr:hypothetical protein [Opitutaceae bacterium]
METRSRSSFFCRVLLLLVSMGGWTGLGGAPAPLLVQAFEDLHSSRDDLAFTQRSRELHDDGRVRTERLERYDPSLPDRERWRLLEIDGRAPTEAERQQWEHRRNAKPRKRPLKSPAAYLDLEHARVVEDTADQASFEIPLRPDVLRLLAVEKISVVVTVDKPLRRIERIGATLREPARILMGLARITDLDVDVRLDPPPENSTHETDRVQDGSTARVTLSKLGSPTEYRWSELKRVKTYAGAN